MNLRGTAFKWDMLGQELYVGELANRLPVRKVNDLTPKFSNIRIKDILVENAETFVKIYGIPESPLEDVVLENIQVNHSNQFFRAADVKDIVFRDMIINSKDSLMTFLNTRNVLFENSVFNVKGEQIFAEVEGDSVETILFKNTQPPHPANWETNEYDEVGD